MSATHTENQGMAAKYVSEKGLGSLSPPRRTNT